ncbi:MAG: hypothetical protein B7Z66_12625 [Chromatiales bacterium 21-64-14]|nr:MAG: hypothetical protein B7Z66_12625 [Chromatiales bacterium 21-64-14]HQU17029.1 flippase [Gammaproteobacteria bacterium]
MSLKRNTLYNLTGSLTLIGVSLVTIPLYLHLIGNARYGVLAIVLLLLGYFNFFDLGLARATANRIAQLHDAPPVERERVFWTALALNACFGLAGGLVLYGVAGVGLAHFFKMPESMRVEVLSTLPWLAASVPVATISGVLTGTLEGRERFGVVNSLQVLGSLLFQITPLTVAYVHGPNLNWLIPAAILARTASMLPLAAAVTHALPLRGAGGPQRALAKRLLSYGGWVTATSLVGPALETLDRLLIGTVLGAASVTYYTVPSELASRFRILPGAIARSLFPRMSSQSADDASRQTADSLRILAALMTPLIVLGILVMAPFLKLWVGAEFAADGAPVGQIILVGVWINSLAFLPYTQLQSQGRPDLVAKFHLLELAPFVGLLWLGLTTLGLVGAALVYSLRGAVDAGLLFWASGQWPQLRAVWPGAGLVLAAWGAVQLAHTPGALLLVGIPLSIGSVVLAWRGTSRTRMKTAKSAGQYKPLAKIER